ncbi:MAG: flavin reductase family protein [Lentisphaeria bacterium]|nr:flavin reductase family protein [Candidatus Neomarinimicrobiota bacterium]MCF7842447.1 flavin reductase family protein [Lentisphaeria bacterium]
MQKQVPYSEAKSKKFPEPVHISIIRDKNGKYNPISMAWAMFTSIDPLMVAISIGFERYSYDAIEHSGEFVFVLPSESMGDLVEFFGNHSGREMDKLAESGAKTQPATKIDNVLLSDAAANFECVVKSKVRSGDHMIYAGLVVASHINTEPANRLFSVEHRVFGGVKPK